MEVLLAYRIYPAPQGKSYYRDDLNSAEQVVQLFDYCQILEAIIYTEGWDYLIDHFGYEKLFELNSTSGWKDCNNIEEFIQEINNERSRGMS